MRTTQRTFSPNLGSFGRSNSKQTYSNERLAYSFGPQYKHAFALYKETKTTKQLNNIT